MRLKATLPSNATSVEVANSVIALKGGFNQLSTKSTPSAAIG